MTLAEIKRRLENTRGVEPAFLEALRQDRRVGARKLYRRVTRRMKREAAEAARVRGMYRRDRELAGRRAVPVAGVDEAGRGPIAGPVAAAAVILVPEKVIPGLDDSKKMTAVRRAQVATRVREEAAAWSVALASVKEIELYNILGATFLAMRRAIGRLQITPAWLLVDGNMRIPDIAVPQSTVVRGDARCASIAAASVLAKVFRDKLMVRYHHFFPDYGFAQHKGYGTAQHYESLDRLGPTPIHRVSGRDIPDFYKRGCRDADEIG